MNRSGFTLLEVIIVIAIFSIVSIVSVNAYMNGFKSEQRSYVQNKTMQDARFIMNEIKSLVQTNQIDFEEYFSQCVIQGSCPNKDFSQEENRIPLDSAFGLNHGYYDWQFYAGGFQNATETLTDGFGAVCQTADGSYESSTADSCVTGGLEFSEDSFTGSNPSTTTTEVDPTLSFTRASAFCADRFQAFTDEPASGISIINSATPCTGSNQFKNVFNELYLINPESKQKTIIGRSFVSDSPDTYALSLMKLDPVDTSSTQLDFPVVPYQCAEGFICTEESNIYDSVNASVIPDGQNLNFADRFSQYNPENRLYTNFIPLSPLSVNVKNLQFIVTPNEDPYKAFREPGLNHPTVTVILEIEPSKKYKLPFFSTNFNLKLQTTVSTKQNTSD
jgi:prepilin-type N-terminal cleavage/methylation domain-containing protein